MQLHPRDYKILLLVLLVGLVHGLIYVFIVPPWQHYDEPNHFEYAWLIADRETLPKRGDYDQSMRRAVAISMIELNFFDRMGFLPDLESKDQAIWIGTYSQIPNPPGYYIMTSLPLGLTRFLGIEGQLYAARLISLSLYLITILVSWLIMVELTPKGHPLRVLVPLSLALLPGFVDLMTAVNNDVGAVVLFSIFLWGAVRLVSRGFSWLTFLWTTAAVVLIYWTKETAYAAFPLYIITIIFSIFSGSRRWVAWSLLTVSAIIGLIAIFSWGDAAFWARNTLQKAPTRISANHAPVGRFILQVENNKDGRSYYQHGLYQLIPTAIAKELSGKTVTLGAWMWASEPVIARTPVLQVFHGDQTFYQDVELGDAPDFYTFNAELEGNTVRAWVSLTPLDKNDSREVTVFYDGIVLVEGERPPGTQPVFEDRYGRRGSWGGQPFENLIRNPSAETGWPQVRRWADVLGGKYMPDYTRPSWIMAMITDRSGAGWFFDITAKNLFRTYWAKFGWGHVPLMGHKPYRILAAFTALGIVGAIIALWRKRKTAKKEIILIFSLVLLAVWGPTYIRGANFILLRPYFPTARYAYPAIIPTMLVLNLGWLEIFRYPEKWLKLPAWVKYLVFCVLFVSLAIWSILTIVIYYGF